MAETVSQISLEEAIATGNRLKDEARSLVQAKNYTAAIQAYQSCYDQLVSVSPPTVKSAKKTKVEQEKIDLLLMLLCNLSLCYFCKEDYENSLNSAQKAGAIDPNHLKAAYRRALALKKLGRYTLAFEEIKNARLIAIGRSQVDEQINREYNVIKQLYCGEKLKLGENPSLANSAIIKNPSHLANSALSNVVDSLDNNFPSSLKTTPFYGLFSLGSTFLLLKGFMGSQFTQKHILLSSPFLAVSIFGFLQGKHIITKVSCGCLIGIITSLLFKFARIQASN